jgi:Spy/CpxP family protein refolding chaperone
VVLNKTFRPLILAGVVAGLLLCAAVRAQAQHHGGGGSGGGFGGMGGGHNGMGGSREGMGDRGSDRTAPVMRSGPQLAPPGRWWDDGKTIKHLSLRPEQKERMDEIFNANKGSLLNTFANLQREETRLGTMTPQDLQDETKVFAAIDRVTQARAGLEKESAHIQMQLRQQLTPAQVSMLDQQIASLH